LEIILSGHEYGTGDSKLIPMISRFIFASPIIQMHEVALGGTLKRLQFQSL
jgi:hypothetical protein